MPDPTPTALLLRRTPIAPRPGRAACPPLLLRRRGALVLAVVALAGVVAASSLTVVQNRETQALYAERFEVAESFVVESSGVWPTKVDRVAVGGSGAPAELAAPFGEARTSLVRDQWVYSVTVKERSADAVANGVFTIDLVLDEVPKGRLFVAQATRDANAAEGVRASFALGPALATSALYHVIVKPYVPTGPMVEFTLKSTPSGDLTWTGSGGSIDGAVNPGLEVAPGSTLKVTAVNADGIAHNFGVKDSANALVDPPGWTADIEASGDTEVWTWTPTAAGAYTYLCKYHPTTMKGTVTVTA